MPSYTPPVDDMLFLLNTVFGAPDLFRSLPKHAELDSDIVATVLEEAGKFCTEILHPLNMSGDQEGCQLKDGIVHTPKGFREAYAAYAEAGWGGLSAPPEYGGQGLPRTIQILVDEMLSASNLSFGLFPGLTRGAFESIASHADEKLKDIYLARMISGEWTGAMALTEGGAGSDLGLLKTTARPRGDGSYSVNGSKIFISSGDHDMAENIIHLVLARLPDAPPGTKGISLFLCPKILVNEDGSAGAPNTISVSAIEHKMGIHAQPTCVMNYDDCQGWLVGEPHRGLAAMFTMMNAERLFVGMQGLGVADASYQTASLYAKERLQGRVAGHPETVAIIEHPDVRRMLLTMLSFIEAGRALAVFTALEMDKEDAHPDAETRRLSGGLVALLTPVIKAALTDFGFETTVLGQQVLGGHGYIREWGQEQLVRDARIAMIYEGTNGIQAQDLVLRKLELDEGRPLAHLFSLIAGTLSETDSLEQLAPLHDSVSEALTHLRDITARLTSGDLAGPQERNAAATDYLRLFALTCFGWLWLRMGQTVCVQDLPSAAAQRKLLVGRFFADRILPQTASLARQIGNGAKSIASLQSTAF